MVSRTLFEGSIAILLHKGGEWPSEERWELKHQRLAGALYPQLVQSLRNKPGESSDSTASSNNHLWFLLRWR